MAILIVFIIILRCVTLSKLIIIIIIKLFTVGCTVAKTYFNPTLQRYKDNKKRIVFLCYPYIVVK